MTTWNDLAKPYPDDLEHPLSVVASLWNGRDDIFPGPQPISIERQHFPSLINKNYHVCDKTDGVRYAFICCTIDDKKVATVMDRSLKTNLLKLRIPRECAKGTVLDGEIIQRMDGTWIFLVYDCVVMCGKPINTLSFSERMSFTDTFIDMYKKQDTDALLFLKKDIFPLENISMFLDEERPYKTDGVILIPGDDPIRVNTHPFYFKLKNGHENTVDFAINNKGDLFLQTKGELKKTTHHIKDKSAKDVQLTVRIKDEAYAMIECKFVKDKEWTFVCTRPDKILPNSVYTHKKTMLNIRENIQVNELRELA
jgi:hypothetical protein